MIKQTHTYVQLPVSEKTYNEIKSKLLDADNANCILRRIGAEQESIILPGIALIIEEEDEAILL